jgi:hypothetical protein
MRPAGSNRLTDDLRAPTPPADAGMIEEKGSPRLPRICRSLAIPDDGVVECSVLAADSIEMREINIAPSKGHLLRSINPDDEYPFRVVSGRQDRTGST